MDDFNFATHNGYIEGKIVTRVVRDVNTYTVYSDAYLKRNNDYGDTPTQGNIYCYLYINNDTSPAVSKYFTVSNGGDWCWLGSFKKTYDLSPLVSTTFSVGIAASSSTTGLQIDSQHTSEGMEVPAYAGTVYASTISIQDTGYNAFRVVTTTGKGNTNNNAKSCHIYYTVNGDTPDADKTVSPHSKGIDTRCPSGKTYSNDFPVSQKLTAKAVAYTIGDYGNTKSDVVSDDVIYYEEPKNQPTPTISLFKDSNYTIPDNKLTNKSYIKVTWDAATDGNSDSPNNGCRRHIQVWKVSDQKWYSYINGSIKGVDEYVDIYYDNQSRVYNTSSHELSLVKGDKIRVAITPWHYHKDTYDVDRWWVGTMTYSEEVTVESAGIINIATASGLTEGQAYVNSGSGWIEADGIYMYSKDGWVESV